MNAVLNLQPEAADTLTVLTHVTRSHRLSKRWLADGTIEGYEDAKTFKIRQVPIRGIDQFARLLADELIGDPYTCIIRGRLREEHTGERVVHKSGAYFKPVELHLLALDVDNYVPCMADLSDPTACVREFIQLELPDEFQNVTCVYHLSASFGHPSVGGKLKAHLFFWLVKPQYGSVLKAWIKQLKIPVDASMTQDVQAIYTANPVFDPGVEDPAAGKRGGVLRGAKKSVDLNLDGVDVSAAVSRMKDEYDMPDPTTKKGAIGLFCRTFTMDDVLSRWLSDVFLKVNDRRLTYLKSTSGAVEGAWVTDCGEYIGNQHDSCPFDGRLANKWDLVRVFVYGHLDEGLDAFARMNVSALPSQAAMLAMVQGLDEIKREQRSGMEKWRAEIAECAVADDLLGSVAAQIAGDSDVNHIQREQLAQVLQARVQELGGGRIRIDSIRGLLRPADVTQTQRPQWASGLIAYKNEAHIVQMPARAEFSYSGFNLAYRQHAVGGQMPVDICAENGWFTMVAGQRYRPDMPELFTDEDGHPYLNSYNPASVPVAGDMGPVAQSCVDAFKAHMLRLFSGRQALVDHLIQWMAHNVQHPGKKILWAMLIKGTEGDGKTLIRNVLEAAMGSVNVGEVSSKTLHSEFNGYVEGKCVRMLEEIRVVGKSRHDVLDSLKAPITNRRVTVHKKGQDEYDTLNVTNYMAFSNHSDALALSKADRRWLVIFSPYLHRSEIEAEVGMGIVEYFEPIHQMYREFAAHVRHWLLNVDLTGFDPVKPAIVTDEKAEMQELGQSDDEAIVREIVEGLDVVQSKWVSQMYAKHPDATRLSTKMMPKILERLGYRTWYKQFKLKYKNGEDHNVTIYGKKRSPTGREETVAELETTGQTENVSAF